MPSFSFRSCKWNGGDSVTEDDGPTLDWFISEEEVRMDGICLCRLQQGVGHCCGATYITQISPDLPANFDALLTHLKEFKRCHHIRWPIQNDLFFYLSDETVLFDEPIRKHPKVKELFTFKNTATKPYSGSNVTLFTVSLV